MLSVLAERISSLEVLSAHNLEHGRPIIARLIGRRFDLTSGRFEQPYDPEFGKMMLKTLLHLCAELGATYAFCERSEMSLFAVSNGGEARRLVSRINGEAAGKLSLLLGEVVTFETRLFELPSADAACDYFLWRSEASQAESLDAFCAHVLAKTGADPQAVPTILDGLDVAEKLELLRQNDFDYASLPAWQRKGAGVYVAHDTTHNGSSAGRLVVDLNLPDAGAYADFLKRFVAAVATVD